MQRELVPSTNVVSVGYDEATQTLEVEFKDGSVYQYYNITPAVYDQFMRAPSKGQYVNAYLRNAFPYSRVS